MRSTVGLVGLLLLTSFPAYGDVPGTVAGRVILDGQPASEARVEMTAVGPWSGRVPRPRCVASTNATGRFVCLGLLPAQTYDVRITFANGFISIGMLNDVRGAEVRHVVTTVRTARCGTNLWREEPARSPLPFEWPLRDRRNHVLLCI